MLGLFAETDTVPVSAEPLFGIGGITITNTMLTGVLIGLVLIALFIAAARRSTMVPTSKFAFFMESLVEFVTGQMTGSFNNDEKKVRKFAPLFITFFVFILLNNLFGLLPGFGAVTATTHEGLKEALLRSFTTDLNGTFALAAVTMLTVQFYAIRARGGWGYIKHFFSVMTPWWNPANLFLGPLEIISEITRLLTLALRLFGVIYAGEVLLHVIAHLTGNFSWLGTVPILLMEIFFASLQAYLFIMLSSVYLQLGTTTHDDEHHNDESSPAAPKLKAGEATNA